MKICIHNQAVTLSFLGLLFVVVIWGFSPLLTLYFYDYYSPTARVCLAALIGAASMLLVSLKHLKLLDRSYLRVAIPTGLFYTAANMLQKIGLQYTTPAHYAVLENLACVVVPFLLLLFIKKKPTWLTLFASALCICSTVVITGFTGGGEASLKGDILCALAGLFYGVNTAATGVYAKKLYAPLYLMIQLLTEAVISGICALVFHSTGMEPLRFSFDGGILLAHAGLVIMTSTIGWLIRTNAMKHVDPSIVAVIMPFASAVTAILSVALGKEAFTWNLVAGVTMGITAIILSGLGDRPVKRR